MVLPCLVVMVVVCALMALVWGIQSEDVGTIWVGAGGMIAGAGAIGVVAYLYSRQAREQVTGLFGHVARSTVGNNDEEMLGEIAAAVEKKIGQVSKDNAQLLTILSSMSDGLVATDHQQKILLVNPAARLLLGMRSKPEGLAIWEAIGVREIVQAVGEVMLTGELRTLETGPVEGKFLEVTVRRLPSPERHSGVVVVVHDVTQAHRYQELRKEFVANVSHELRTPLTMIKGFIETLRDGAIDDRPRAMEYLATVERHSDQLSNLVSDLLDVSRLESGGEMPAVGPVHLDAVARKAVELTIGIAEKKVQTLNIEIADGVPVMTGNGEYLQRAMVNLLENAIKYTKEKGTIALSVRGGPREIAVEVSDNGIGIASEDLPRIFERFYRVDRSRSREMGGTGLGLSIVKHVVQSHGGTIEVKSELGKGSTFTMRFPTGSHATQAQSK